MRLTIDKNYCNCLKLSGLWLSLNFGTCCVIFETMVWYTLVQKRELFPATLQKSGFWIC